MHYRIYNSKDAKFLNSNSHAILGNGTVVELRELNSVSDCIVEAWTGYFDKDGKKIYCGDILEQYSFFTFRSKVVWKHGSFMMVPIDPEGIENTMGYSGILKGWTITGNIHEVEYSEGK